MTAQLALPMKLPRPRKMTAAERFAAFHEAYPEVYAEFVRFAREAKAAGFGRFPAAIIASRVNYYFAIEARQANYAKLTIRTTHIPRYARKAMAECSDLKTFFMTRKLRVE